MHERYAAEHGFLDARTGAEVVTISRVVNAFLRWEFNSCESLVRGGEVYPIDHANACPDVALTSLPSYLPSARTSPLRWTVFCVVTGRRVRVRLDPDTARCHELVDRAICPTRTDWRRTGGRPTRADRCLAARADRRLAARRGGPLIIANFRPVQLSYDQGN